MQESKNGSRLEFLFLSRDLGRWRACAVTERRLRSRKLFVSRGYAWGGMVLSVKSHRVFGFCRGQGPKESLVRISPPSE